jgi:lipopolysaccharide exporter
MTTGATPPKESIRDAMISGSVWMISMRWAIRGIGLVSTVILARLLMPEDFGIVDMGNIVVGLIDIFLSFGVELALIQQANASRDHYDTAWTIRLLQSIGVAILVVALTPLAIDYFNEPRLEFILPILGLGVAISGLENIGVVAFRKELDFRKEFMFNVIKKLCSFTITIGLAWYYRSYWALVCGIVGGQILSTIFSYWLHPYRPRWCLKMARDIWGFSQWMLCINILYYINQRGSEVVVGGHTSAAQMGIYAVSTEISELPTTEVIYPVSRALFPGYALIKNEPERLKTAYLNVLGFIATVTTGAGLGISLVAQELVPIMLGSKWMEGIVIIQCLAISGLIRATYATAGNVMLALGRAKRLAIITGSEVILQITGALIGVSTLGILGVAWGKIVCAIVFSFVFFAALCQCTGIQWRDIRALLLRPLVAGAGMIVVVRVLELILPTGLWLPFLLKTLVGGASFTLILFGLWRFMGQPKGFESFAFEQIQLRLKKAS